jgi:hypothetical protein
MEDEVREEKTEADPCGCKGRMEDLREKHPKVARAVEPLHNAAMSVVDAVAKWGDPKRRVIGSP